MMRKIAFLLVFLFSTVMAFSQTRTIKGKVFDESGSGMPGATVQLKGTQKGSVTDIDGNYSIVVPTEGGTLSVSYVGYKIQEMAIAESDEVNFNMALDVQNLDQVVVVGYGVQKKSLVTGSISKIDSKDLTTAPVSRVDQALQGKTSGVFMAQSSGSPGAAMSVKIRGNSSNGKNDPLYIVDGIKTSGIDFLSPNDIESIEVLKDAASSAIYGSEGGNGVIIVTTKKAKEGTSEINYNYYHGEQTVSNYVKMMDSKQFVNYQREAYNTSYIGDRTIPKYLKQIADFDVMAARADTVNSDWMDIILQSAPVDEHNISFASATDKNKLYLSASYLTQDGIVGGSKNNFTRYTVHFSGDAKMKEWLNVGSNVSYTRSEKNNLRESSEFGGIISNAMFFDPTVPVYCDDTSIFTNNKFKLKPESSEYNALVKNDDGRYFSLSDYTIGETRNPVAQIYNTHSTTVTDKVLGDIHAELKLAKGLTVVSKLALDYSLAYDNIISPKEYYSTENKRTSDTSGVTVENTFGKQYKYSFENYMTFNRSFGDHSIEAMAGMSYEKFVPHYLDVTGYTIPENNIKYAYLYNTLSTVTPLYSGGIGTIDNNDAAGQKVVINYSELQNSYFGRIVYNYKEKLMLQGNIRRDGSSLFGPEYMYGTFPSFSIGYNIGKEDYFSNIFPFINAAKIRGSWGQNGNKQILEPFQYTSNMVLVGINYPNSSGTLNSGAVPDNPGNSKLHWETSQQLDFGIDLQLFQNKVTFSVDYFDKKTIDQLAKNALVPLYLGFTNIPYTNSGKVQNKGLEFDLAYRKSDGDFKFTTSINASYLKNKVLSYGQGGAIKDGIKIGTTDYVTRYEAGFPVYYYKGYQAIGIFQDVNEINSYVNSNNEMIQPKALPGDVKYADINGDGEITGADGNSYLGKPMPDWTFGFNFSFEYKGFDFNSLVQGVTGNQIFFAAMRTDRLLWNKPEFYYTNRWTGPGTSNKYPRASIAFSGTKAQVNNGYATENFNWSNINVYDGDYVRLKNVTLGYTIPKNLTSKIGIGRFRVYFTVSNVLTITDYPGSDPEIGQVVASEAGSYGVDRGLYPASRTYTAGVNVTF